MTDHDITAIRAKADEIIARAAADTDFNARLAQDPVTVLEEAGLDTDHATALATEYTLVDTVGHMQPTGGPGCTFRLLTCIFRDNTMVSGPGGPCGNCFTVYI